MKVRIRHGTTFKKTYLQHSDSMFRQCLYRRQIGDILTSDFTFSITLNPTQVKMSVTKRQCTGDDVLNTPALVQSILELTSVGGDALYLRSVNKLFAGLYGDRSTTFRSIFASLPCLQYALASGFDLNTYRMSIEREVALHRALARAASEVIECALFSGYPIENSDLITAAAAEGRSIVLLQRLLELGAACDHDEVFEQMVLNEDVGGLIWVCGLMSPEERAHPQKLLRVVAAGCGPLLPAALDMLLVQNTDNAVLACIGLEHEIALRMTEVLYPHVSLNFDVDNAFVRSSRAGHTGLMTFYHERGVVEPTLAVAQFAAEIDNQADALQWFQMHLHL